MQVFATLLSDRSYLEAVLVLNKSLKTVNSKYSLLTVVTSSIGDDYTISLLQSQDIIVEVADDLQYSPTLKNLIDRPYILNTASKFCLFQLDANKYEKIVYMDADVLVLENIDDLMNYPDGSMLFLDDYDNFSSLFVIELKYHEEFEIYDFLLKQPESQWNDGALLGAMWFHVKSNPQYQIPSLYQDFYPFDTNINITTKSIHFIGDHKPWLPSSNKIYNTKEPVYCLYQQYLQESKQDVMNFDNMYVTITNIQNNNLHDPHHDYRDTPPYTHYMYKSTYDGVIVEIQIVDHCNLNCASCNHFSPIAKPWHIPLEDFSTQVLLLKENIPNLKTLILVGGEPTLHPQLIEICTIARTLLPSLDIQLFTNGLKLNKMQPELDALQKLNIYINCSSYPGQYDLAEMDKMQSEFSNIGFHNTRIFMDQTIVNPKGNEDAQYNHLNCAHHTIPCFTLKDSKLYLCPFAAHAHHYFEKANLPNPETNFDYLPIEQIQKNPDILQDFIFSTTPICRFCKHCTDNILWQKSYRDLTEFDTTLSELYFTDYNRYEQILLQNKDYFFNCLNKDTNHAIARVEDCGGMVEQMKKRFGYGKIDIIIPYYRETAEILKRLHSSLLSQTIIEDCIIYLISDCSPVEEYVIELFNSTKKLQCVFLRTPQRSGPGVARNKGLDNSHNKYILMFDADDYFADNNALEYLYTELEDRQRDIYWFNMHQDEDKTHFKHNMLIKRESLQDLRFLPIFIGEDYIFSSQLAISIPDDKMLDQNSFIDKIAIYGVKNNHTNLTNECNSSNTEFAILSSRFLLYLQLKAQQYNDAALFKEIVIALQDIYLKTRVIENKILSYYLLYQIYIEYPQYCQSVLDIILLTEFKQNIFYIVTQSSVLTDIKVIKNLCLNYINSFNNNIIFKAAADILKQSLE